MTQIPLIKRFWRALRTTQPFNSVATRLCRLVVPPGRWKDKISDHLPYLGLIRFDLPHGKAVTFRSYGDDYILNKIFWTRQYERELSNLFFELAQHARCTLDIGAHVGFYSLLAGESHPENQVFAFEPHPRIYERLAENIQINGKANIHAIHSAVGNHDGSIEFFSVKSPHLPSNSSAREKSFLDAGQEFNRTRVPEVTLDTFCREKGIHRVDLIKMDTEGTELDVLEGAAEILQRDRPSIVCEVLERLADVQALERLLRPLGYLFYRLEDAGPVLVERIQGSVDWRNYLFTPMKPDVLKAISNTRGSTAR